MQELSKKILFINIMLTQVIMLLVALAVKYFFAKKVSFAALLQFQFQARSLLILFTAILILVTMEFLFYKYVPKAELVEEINLLLMEKFRLSELVFIFLLGAFIEELLFRFLLQPLLGIVISSLIFTLVHVRYLSKKFMLLEVFLLSIVLGVTYQLTAMLYIPVLCHFAVNVLTAVLIKKGFISLADS